MPTCATKKVTKKLILDTVAKECNIKREYIDLAKFEGFYYWGERAGAVFNECCAYTTRLDDWDLDRWVDDFKSKAANSIEWNDHETLQSYIESIDWKVE